MFVTSGTQLVQVFYTKLLFNLKSEASGLYLSYLWWLLEPALFVAVFYLVFGVLLLRGTENFLVFLLLGKIPYLWLSKSISKSADSITRGRGLINQISIPKPIFPLLVVCQDGIKQLVVFSFLIVFLVAYGLEPHVNWLYLVPLAAIQLSLIVAGALLVAAVTPFLPDFRYLVSTLLMLLMFGSGIFYSYKDVITPEYQELFLMNPLALLIKNYRQVIMDGVPPDWPALGLTMLLCWIAIWLLLMFYRRYDSAYARLVIQ